MTGEQVSHDQRPAKIRVVGDGPAGDATRRTGDAVTIDGKAETLKVAQAGGAAALAGADAGGGEAAIAKGGGVALVPAMLFLLACIAGGAIVGILRPFGLG